MFVAKGWSKGTWLLSRFCCTVLYCIFWSWKEKFRTSGMNYFTPRIWVVRRLKTQVVLNKNKKARTPLPFRLLKDIGADAGCLQATSGHVCSCPVRHVERGGQALPELSRSSCWCPGLGRQVWSWRAASGHPSSVALRPCKPLQVKSGVHQQHHQTLGASWKCRFSGTPPPQP